MLYPWQLPIWQRLHQQRQTQHHALLLTGETGLGKMQFAETLAWSLLCQQPSEQGWACQQCACCHLMSAGNHPDFRRISPADGLSDAEDEKKTSEKKTTIQIAQIRALNDFFAISSHHAAKVVLIHPAESMNIAAANALLKTLEEPPKDTYFILVSHRYQLLPATIRSRCQQLVMPAPSLPMAQQWLEQQGYTVSVEQLKYVGASPLLAMQLTQFEHILSLTKLLMRGKQMDVGQAVASMQSLGMADGIQALQKWMHDLMMSAQDLPQRYHSEPSDRMQALARGLNAELIDGFNQRLHYYHRYSQHPLNQELQWESIFIQYKQLFET